VSAHQWIGHPVAPGFEKVAVVMRRAWPIVEALPKADATLCECRVCGLTLARVDGDDGERTLAYGIDLESLAVMGSPPRCGLLAREAAGG